MAPSEAADRASGEATVVVVAHDAGDLLEACVASAAAQVGEPCVVVVDAESRDGSVEAMLTAHPGVRVIPAPNRGFAASNNTGIAATAGPFVLLLNPDAELRPGALEALTACAHAHPRAGIVGAAVLNADGSMQANQAGRFPSLATVLGLRVWRALQRLVGNRALSPRGRGAARRVDWVTGACMLVRREAIEDAGPMDDGYFLYYEDVEWCHRMADHGWQTWQEPFAEVVHHLGKAGGGSREGSRAYRESFYRYCDQYRLWGLKAAARLMLRDPGGGETVDGRRDGTGGGSA